MPDGQVLVREGQGVFKFKLLHKQQTTQRKPIECVLSRLAVVVRVDGDELELELEGVGPSSSILY